jgi:hypothetical protein
LLLIQAFYSCLPEVIGTEVKGLIMAKDKDRSGRNSANERDRNMRERTSSSSHKTGRGGGNRK